jgi:hypothetical protein
MLSFHTRLFARIVAKGREVYLLKILSLSVALASATLVILFSLNEFGFDRFHENYNAVFRVLQRNNDESYQDNRLSTKIPDEVITSLQSSTKDSFLLSRVKVMNEVNLYVGDRNFPKSKNLCGRS